MRRCAVAKASCSRLRSIKAPPCFDARITSKRVCALPHPRDPPDVSAPLRMETDDSEPPIIIIAPSVRETNEKRKGKGKKEKWAGTPRGDGVFDASDCVYLIGSGAQQRSIVDDRLLEYTRSYRSVVLRWFVRGEGRYWSRTDGWCRFDDSWRTTIPRVNINRTLPLNRDGYSRRQFAFNYGKYCRTPAVHCQYIPSDRSEYCLLIIIISVNIVERN